MIAEPNAMSHGLITGGGGAFIGIFRSAANPEPVEQPRASAAAHARFFMTSPSPDNHLPGLVGSTHIRKGSPLAKYRTPPKHALLRSKTKDSGKLKKRNL